VDRQGDLEGRQRQGGEGVGQGVGLFLLKKKGDLAISFQYQLGMSPLVLQSGLRAGAAFVADFVPGVSGAKGVSEAATGVDFGTGDGLGTGGRVIAAAGVAPGGKWIGKGLGAAWKFLRGLFRHGDEAAAVVKNAATKLPNLQGMSRADAHIAIRNKGFQYHGTTSGGYVRYRHSDGSEIWIRPNGEVMRLGPKPPGQPNRPRYDPSGNVADHPQGEFLPPLPGHGN
jgi:hypothetical protein